MKKILIIILAVVIIGAAYYFLAVKGDGGRKTGRADSLRTR